MLDFYCPSAKLGIEIDGAAHDSEERQNRDNERDEWLAGQGITIVRIPAADVLKSVPNAAEAILALCRRAE